jgi:hypothetical protein
MDIIVQLKTERDKAAQQVNALDTARERTSISSETKPENIRSRSCSYRSRSSCEVGQG